MYSSDKTYTATTLSKDEIVENRKSVLSYFRLSTKDDDSDLPSTHWAQELHKNPCKQLYKAGYANFTTKPISKLLTSVHIAVK